MLNSVGAKVTELKEKYDFFSPFEHILTFLTVLYE